MQLNKDTLGYLFLTYGKILWVITMKKKTKQVERIKTNRFTKKQTHIAVQCDTFKEALKEFNK